MSWFRKSKNTITVEFIENGTNNPFAVSEVPTKELPDTFELETSLEIGEQLWSIARAIPVTKEEFSKTGKLEVFLKKVETIDPRELLFTLPTINNSIFETDNTTSGNLFSIHEDDWRQVEFISKKYGSEVTQEIKSIVEIYEKHRVGIGFDKVHIRQLIEQPLYDENINIEALMQDFIVIKDYDGFGIGNYIAKDSFAFQVTGEITFYGQVDNNGRIVYLCCAGDENLEQATEKIIEKYDVFLVNWCEAKIIEK